MCLDPGAQTLSELYFSTCLSSPSLCGVGFILRQALHRLGQEWPLSTPSLCSLGQEKEGLFPHDSRESSGQSFNWLGLVVLPSMSQSLWPTLGCSDWPFLGPVLLRPRQPGCRVSPSLVGYSGACIFSRAKFEYSHPPLTMVLLFHGYPKSIAIQKH